MRKLFDGFQRHYHLDSSTVRVGDNTARTVFGVSGIYLGHNQRHIGVHTESAGIVDHHGSVLGNGFGELFRGACACGSESDINPFKVIVVLQEFNLDLFTAEGVFSAGTAFRTEQH